MLWKKRSLTYEICVPPLNKSNFDMTPEDAEAYFQWFLACLPERVGYVSTIAAKERGIPKESLDLSPDSLLPLWAWFLSRAKIEKTPRFAFRALKREYSCLPTEFRKTMLDGSREHFSLETEFILRDIGMYLGEVFVKNTPGISWGWYDRPEGERDRFVNTPLLLGFEDPSFTPPFQLEFEPIHMARVQAASLFCGDEEDDALYRLYTLWADRYAPKRGRE